MSSAASSASLTARPAPGRSPLDAPALALLARLPRVEGSPYVFPSIRGIGPLVGLQKIWNRIRQRAGLEDVRLHDLRHSFASVGAAGGDSLYIIGKLLGHAQQHTTQRYAHLADDPMRAAADRISRQVWAEVVELKKGPYTLRNPRKQHD